MESPTDFLMRMLEGENIEDVTQVLVVKRYKDGAISAEYCNMQSVDVLGCAKYLDVSESENLRVSLQEYDD